MYDCLGFMCGIDLIDRLSESIKCHLHEKTSAQVERLDWSLREGRREKDSKQLAVVRATRITIGSLEEANGYDADQPNALVTGGSPRQWMVQG